MSAMLERASLAVALIAVVGALAPCAHAQGWQAGTRAPAPQQSNTPSNSVGTYPGYGQGYGSTGVVSTPYGSTSSGSTTPTGNGGPQSVGPVDTGTTSTGTQWRSIVRQPAQTNQSGSGYNNQGYNGRGYNSGGYGNYGNQYDDGTTNQYRGDPALRYNDPYRYSNPYGPPVRSDCVDVNGVSIPCNR